MKYLAAILIVLSGCSDDRLSSCEELERIYLDNVTALKSTASFGSLASNDDLRAMAEQIDDKDLKQLELSFLDLGDKCGDRAAMVAHRKATEIVFGQ